MSGHVWEWDEAASLYVCPTCGPADLCRHPAGGPADDDPGIPPGSEG